MKKYLITLVLSTLFLALSAQDVDRDRRFRERVMVNSEKYSFNSSSHDTIEVGTQEKDSLLQAVLAKSKQELLLDRMQSIEKAIREKDYDAVKPLFTKDAYDSFLKLIRRGNAVIVGKPEYRFAKYGQRTLCRGLTLKLNFRNNKQFVEELDFRINADNLVESIAFQLSAETENDIMEKEEWAIDSRLALVTFLEDYQTAYSLGRIVYIDSIFNKDFQNQHKDSQKVEYDTLRLKKQEYVKRLGRHFAAKESVILNITETEVLQSNMGMNLYGVRLKHEYCTNECGDSGYLFVLVCVHNGTPTVLFSVWQNDDVPRDSLIGLEDIY